MDTLKQIYKPDSVLIGLAPAQTLIIYLELPSPTISNDLPAGIERVALRAPAYLVFQPVRFTLPRLLPIER